MACHDVLFHKRCFGRPEGETEGLCEAVLGGRWPLRPLIGAVWVAMMGKPWTFKSVANDFLRLSTEAAFEKHVAVQDFPRFL